MSRLKIRFLFIVLMFVMSNAAHTKAGDELASLQALFTSNATIVDYHLYPADGGVNFDNEARLLTVDNQIYTYPIQIQILLSYRKRDNQLIFDVTESLPDLPDARNRTHNWVWVFDREASTFNRLNMACAEPPNFDSSYFDAKWIYISSPESQQVRLCEMATGKLTEPLPISLKWQVSPAFTTLALPVFDSSDDRWLILFGEDDRQTWVYSYNTQTQHLTSLGKIACKFCIEWDSVKWFGTTITIWSYVPSLITISSAKVTEQDSLHVALTRPEYSPEFYDNPPRYDYVNFTTPKNIWETQCQRVIYDVLSDQKQVTPMGSLCRPEWGTLDGVGYYRDVTRGSEGIAALTMFNSMTSEREVLYTGEIEWINWVSSDRHYAILVLDDSGYIDTPPSRDPLFYWNVPGSPKLAYVDLRTDQIIFEIPTGWKTCDASVGGPNFNWSRGFSSTSLRGCYSTGPTGAIFQRNDHEFLVVGSKEQLTDEDIASSSTRFAALITLTNGVVTRKPLLKGQLIPYTSDYVLRVNREAVTNSFSLDLVPINGAEALAITGQLPINDYPKVTLTELYPEQDELRFSVQRKTSEGIWQEVDVLVKISIH